MTHFHAHGRPAGHDGFNPWRVFLVVATSGKMQLAGSAVFNPWRVFLVVATSRRREASLPEARFQSLAGFLGRCDVSSQIGSGLTFAVSIPGGFSWSLRRIHIPFRGLHLESFNPWRVFLVVATGFSVQPQNGVTLVSIPGGFSWSLRRRVEISPFTLKSFLKARKSTLK